MILKNVLKFKKKNQSNVLKYPKDSQLILGLYQE